MDIIRSCARIKWKSHKYCLLFVIVYTSVITYYWSHHCRKFPLEWPVREPLGDDDDYDGLDYQATPASVKVKSSPTYQVPQTMNGTPSNILLDHNVTRLFSQKSPAIQKLSPRIASLANLEWTVDGAFTKSSRFLTIGMVTAKRSGGVSYLYTSLQSIIEGTTKEEKAEFNVVIFVTDFDEGERTQTRNHVMDAYPELIKTGFIQIITTKKQYYPSLENLRKRYGDSENRVYWRSKQAIDYALLWHYCAPLAEYVLHMEDDVVAAPGFYKKLKAHLNLIALRSWVFVQFNERYNAVAFKCSDLEQLVHFVMLFYDEFPIDWAMEKWKNLREQTDLVNYPDRLFTHIGEKSSLEGQVRIRL